MRQHSLLVRGACFTTAMRVFYAAYYTVRKSGMFKILNAYQRINVHARRPPETRRAR